MGRIVVIGGAGAMGRIVVRDLVETALPDIDVSPTTTARLPRSSPARTAGARSMGSRSTCATSPAPRAP